MRLRVLARSETECLPAANPAEPRVIWELEKIVQCERLCVFAQCTPFLVPIIEHCSRNRSITIADIVPFVLNVNGETGC